MTNPDSVMTEEAETKAIEKWLRMVDKPLTAKKGDQKDRAKHRLKRQE